MKIVSFDQAGKLKTLGFNIHTQVGYWIEYEEFVYDESNESRNWNAEDEYRSAPFLPEALQWFRDEKGIHGWVGIDSRGYYYVIYTTDGKHINSVFDYDTCFKNYYEAENALMDELLNYLEEKL